MPNPSIKVSIRVPARRSSLLIMLDALVALNRDWLNQRARVEGIGAATPNLYEQAIRYRREPRDPLTGLRLEEWKIYPELIADGVGDCEDLAAARVAELRNRGINARPWLARHGRMWHVQVRLPDGRIEDPSKRLGMNPGARA